MKQLSLEDYSSILESAKKKDKNTQQMTDFLREHKFIFLENSVLKIKCPLLVVAEEHINDYRFMILKTKNGYDSTLAFAFKLMGVRKPDVHVYFNNVFFETIHIHIGHASHNFRKPKQFFFFPKDMSYSDRSKWRDDWNRADQNKPMKFPDFYKEWESRVILKWDAKPDHKDNPNNGDK